MALLQVLPMLIPPYEFAHLSCWYYQLYEIEKYDFRVNSVGIMPIPNFIQIHPVVFKLNFVDRQTVRYDQSYMHLFYACHAKNA
jgi:hypothetical protein